MSGLTNRWDRRKFANEKGTSAGTSFVGIRWLERNAPITEAVLHLSCNLLCVIRCGSPNFQCTKLQLLSMYTRHILEVKIKLRQILVAFFSVAMVTLLFRTGESKLRPRISFETDHHAMKAY
jgi:hypothetical protein